MKSGAVVTHRGVWFPASASAEAARATSAIGGSRSPMNCSSRRP